MRNCMHLRLPRHHNNGRRALAACLLLCAILLLRCTAAAGKDETVFPLDTAAWRVSDAYGWREDPFTGEETFHNGVDLACAEGTAVQAVQSGVVKVARRSASYGNCLRILHADGTELLYAHLQYLYVRTGEVVRAGEVLGTAGQTGRATGAHLHLELRRKGTLCDPSALLGLS